MAGPVLELPHHPHRLERAERPPSTATTSCAWAWIPGFIPSLEDLPSTVPSVISPAGLAQLGDVAALLDVRARTEHAAGTILGAQQLSAGKVPFHQSELPVQDAGRIVTFCQSGLRNTVAASALRRVGFDVAELEGSFAGWAPGSTEQSDVTPTRAV